MNAGERVLPEEASKPTYMAEADRKTFETQAPGVAAVPASVDEDEFGPRL